MQDVRVGVVPDIEAFGGRPDAVIVLIQAIFRAGGIGEQVVVDAPGASGVERCQGSGEEFPSVAVADIVAEIPGAAGVCGQFWEL